MLRLKGIAELYSHQVRAIDAVNAGKHVVISTSTSSGKSLVFNVPVFEQLLSEPSAVALYMFPTKALAQDQLRALHELIDGNTALKQAIRPATFDGEFPFAVALVNRRKLDHCVLAPICLCTCPSLLHFPTITGDTPHDERGRIRSRCNLILCNPDILHCAMLPYHNTWSRVLQNLRFVVLDECHVYRGVFGAHVAMVLRRLQRLAVRYGSWPQFIACSATIANPGQLFRQLVPHINAGWHVAKEVKGSARSGAGGSSLTAASPADKEAELEMKL